MFEAVVMSCAIVIARNGLHTLTDAKDEHDKEHGIRVHYAIGTNGKVAAITYELTVEESDDERSGEVHQERAHADKQHIAEDI